MKRLILCAAFGLLAASSANADPSASVRAPSPARTLEPAPLQAAEFFARGLERGVAADQPAARLFGQLRAAPADRVAKQLGLESMAELDETAVDGLLRTYHVDFHAVHGYDGSAPPATLLRDVRLATRLVRVRGAVRSSVVLSEANGQWSVVMLGGAKRAAAIANVSESLARSEGVGAADLFIVAAPAFSLEFLGWHASSGLMLAPLADAPNHALVAGDPVAAGQVFVSLGT